MRVLYNTCVIDPWADVAQELLKQKDFKPVYWIGYSYDDSKTIIPSLFPDIVYQSTEDAWKGIFPKEIRERSPYCYVNIDYLRTVANNELQAFTMMNRLDFTRYSFNTMERERHFINLFKSWYACFEIYKPDLVLSAVFPHRIYDYVLYLICREFNIPFISFQYSMVSGRIYGLTDFNSMGNMLSNEYKKYLNKTLTWDNIPEDIYNAYVKVANKDYKQAEPEYMLRNRQESKRLFKMTGLIRSYIQKKNNNEKQVLLKWKNNKTCFKKRTTSLEETYQTLLGYYKEWYNVRNLKKKMCKLYESLCEPSVKSDKYIYFPLHYQPESTTSPAGDIFVNQMLCIELALKYTPKNIKLYVREHPSQFMSQFLGHTCRIKEFYTDLIKNKRVQLISIYEDPYFLIKNSLAVMTVTGTVGWEAICNKKPVIMFGSIWYEKYNGVIRIYDENSAKRIFDFICNYNYDEHDLMAYLLAFADNSIRAYHYDGYKRTANISKEDSVRNICNKIIELL